MSFQITVLKVLAGHPEGRATVADLTRYVSILISSGSDWTNRTKRLAARVVPPLRLIVDNKGHRVVIAGRIEHCDLPKNLPAFFAK